MEAEGRFGNPPVETSPPGPGESGEEHLRIRGVEGGETGNPTGPPKTPRPEEAVVTPTPDLHFEAVIPRDAEDGALTVVLLHGRGADQGDLQSLRPVLPPGVVLVTPRAPFPGAPWGYGPGWAWYRYVAGDRVESDTLRISLDALDAFLANLPSRLPLAPGAMVLGGFSQGGTLSLAHALRTAAAGGTPLPVLNLSGFLVDDPAVEVEAGAPGLPVFWGHGEQDPAIPHALGRKGRARLEEAGARVTPVDHPGGHWVDPAVMEAASRWILDVTAGEGKGREPA